MIGWLLAFLLASSFHAAKYAEMSDKELWELYKKGDDDALAALIWGRGYYYSLASIAKANMPHQERDKTHEDIVGDFIYNLLKKDLKKRLGLGPHKQSLKAYLSQSMRYGGFNEKKKNKGRPLVEFSADLNLSIKESITDPEIIKELIEKICDLPKNEKGELMIKKDTIERKVLGRYIFGAKIKEIAAELDISAAIASQSKYAALNKVKFYESQIKDLLS